MRVPFEMSREEADTLFVEMFGDVSAPSQTPDSPGEVIEEYSWQELQELLGGEHG